MQTMFTAGVIAPSVMSEMTGVIWNVTLELSDALLGGRQINKISLGT